MEEKTEVLQSGDWVKLSGKKPEGRGKTNRLPGEKQVCEVRE